MDTRACKRFIFGCAALACTSQAAAQGHDQRDLVFIGKPARLESERSVEAAIVIGDDLVVAGHVDGLAAAIGGDLHVVKGARVDGAVVVIGGELLVDQGATVDGMRVTVPGGDFNQVASDLAKASRPEPEPAHWSSGPSARLGQLLIVLALGSLLLLLAPRYVLSTQRALTARPALAFAVGFFAMLAIVPLCVLLLLSVVGIPLIVLAVLTFLVASILGMTALALTLGQKTKLIQRSNNLWGALLLGIALMAAIAMVPFVGAAMALLATAISVGGTLLSRFGSEWSDIDKHEPDARGSDIDPPIAAAPKAIET